jgi:hypothetical protein
MKIRTPSLVFAAAAFALACASAGRPSNQAHAPSKRVSTKENASGMCVESPADPPPCAVASGTTR